MTIYVANASYNPGAFTPPPVWIGESFAPAGRKYQPFLKNVAGPAAGSEKTIMTATGVGVINYIDVIVQGTNGGWDFLLNIYADGALTPQFSADLSQLGGYALGTGTIVSKTAHVFGATNQSDFQVALRWPVPFSNGVKVTLQNVTAASAGTIWTNVQYAAATSVPSWRLSSAGVTNQSITGQPSVGTAANKVIAALTGGPGLVLYQFIAGLGATDVSAFSRVMDVAIDGEVSPSIGGSGTEDWLGASSTYTMAGAIPLWSTGPGISTYSADEIAGGVDLLQLYGGIPYNTGATFTLEPGSEPITSAMQYSYQTVYYQ